MFIILSEVESTRKVYTLNQKYFYCVTFFHSDISVPTRNTKWFKRSAKSIATSTAIFILHDNVREFTSLYAFARDRETEIWMPFF